MDTPPTSTPSGPRSPSALRLRPGVRVEVLDDEALALDPLEGVVHRLEGAAARIVADLHAGRTPALDAEHDLAVLDALISARIVEDLDRLEDAEDATAD